MRAVYNNLAKTATFSSLTEHPRYTVAATMAVDQLSTQARTLGITSEWTKITFTAPVAVDYFCIVSHNLTSAATVYIQANATDVWTSPSVNEVCTVATLITHKFTTTQTYRYWRVTFADPTNTDGYIRFSKLWLSRYMDFPAFSLTPSLPYTSNAEQSFSITNQLYADRRIRYKSGEITLPVTTYTDINNVNAFFDIVDLTLPFILLIWENSLDIEPAIYCALTDSLGWKYDEISGGISNVIIKFRECK
jgi:hypothetical protein